MLDKVFLAIEREYIKSLGINKEDREYHYYQARLNKELNEITFYHVIWENNLKSFRAHVKDTNLEILKYIQSNYFYKVIQFREDTNDKFKEHEMAVYINKIQLTEISKSPKTSHLATLKTIKDFYV